MRDVYLTFTVYRLIIQDSHIIFKSWHIAAFLPSAGKSITITSEVMKNMNTLTENSVPVFRNSFKEKSIVEGACTYTWGKLLKPMYVLFLKYVVTTLC